MGKVNGDLIEDLSPRLQGLILHTMQHAFTHEDNGESRMVGAIGVKIEDLFYLLSMTAMAEQVGSATSEPAPNPEGTTP